MWVYWQRESTMEMRATNMTTGKSSQVQEDTL